jgi:hypothetical protein
MDPVVGIGVGAVITLGGIVLGWKLNQASALRAVADERRYQEKRSSLQRQQDAAGKLDEQLHEALAGVEFAPPGGVREHADRLDGTRTALISAWQRASVLDEPEIEARLQALGMALMVAASHARYDRHDSINAWPLTIAIREVREALTCFQRGDQPPGALFPRSNEIVGLAHPGGRSVGLDGIRDLLVERGAT